MPSTYLSVTISRNIKIENNMIENGIIIKGIIYELKEGPAMFLEACQNCDLRELCMKNPTSPGICLTFNVPINYHFKKA